MVIHVTEEFVIKFAGCTCKNERFEDNSAVFDFSNIKVDLIPLKGLIYEE